ncbi:MAG: hypothetical protein IJP62_09760 [Treponema sp.]|nr:hypothetical protein [Treponema sp.]
MKKFLSCTIFILCALLLTSCQKQKRVSVVSEEEQIEEQSPVSMRNLDDNAKQYLEGKHVFVLLGYGYNDESFVEKTRADLSEKFGLLTEESEGLVKLAVFPNDFMRGSTARISMLYTMLEEEPLAGIVILGAPEATNLSLARLQDKNNGSLPYPVFSLFPQDDMLGSEATADFVLDYAQKAELLASEEVEHLPDFDADTLLENSIQTMLNPREPIPAPEDLQSFVQKIVGPDRTISRYIDTESGLQAQNHFIFN